MSGWHSNQPFFSRGTIALVERWRRFAECGGDTMKIDVIVLYTFLLQIALYNFYTFNLNGPCINLRIFYVSESCNVISTLIICY